MAKNTRTPATTTAKATATVAEAPVADDPSIIIASALATAPDGLTARQLTTDTPLSAGAVTTTLQTLADAGVVARTPGATNGTRKSADVWTLLPPPVATEDTTTAHTTAPDDASAPDSAGPDETTTTDPATPDTTTADEARPDDDTTPAAIGDEATPGATDAGDAVPEAPVSGAPAGKPDLRIIMVAGVLGDHPDGVSAVDIANESGLRAQIVARALAAMQAVDAARILPSVAEGSTVELWVRGEGDPAGVDMANVPTFTECPTCGHKSRIRTATGARRTGPGAPGINSDGSAKLAKGELRTLVLDFINTHPGHELTAGTIARELGRSPGAVGNNLDAFINEGLVTPVDAPGKPVTVTALITTPATATPATATAA